MAVTRTTKASTSKAATSMASAKKPVPARIGTKEAEPKKKNLKSTIGAPSQRTQGSRKGKKAWRKNIDIDEVEEGLEELRVEERVAG